MDHDDDTEAESCAAQTQRTVAAIAHTVASPNAVKSQQIYEKILAEVMTDAPSSDDLVAPPTFEEHNSFRLSIAASASSLYSVPIEEEEWRRRKQHHLKHYNAASLTSLSEIASEEEQQQQQDHGGRLWRLAGEIAAQKASLRGNNRTGPVGHLAETFMERMRSRADPNAMISPPTPPRPDRKYKLRGRSFVQMLV